MNPVLLVARDELRLMRRNRVAVIAFFLLVLLAVTAALTAAAHQQSTAALRARHQAEAQQSFEAQPDRHPHRVVHHGHFIFRPLGPLAAFDPGVDAFTGSSMFLEGHRQNTANFGDVRQSSLLVRFGSLTPAFVLQMVVPLLLVFLGHAAMTRERERGTLRQLLLQGATRSQVVVGKLAALGVVALAAGAPAMLGLGWIGMHPHAQALPLAVLAGGYVAYLALWAVLVVLASTLARRGRDALLGLLTLWVVVAILLPRVGADAARAAFPLATRLETTAAIQRDLRSLGDSHNPDDPHFAQFRQQVLDKHGVTRIEDLPVNYKGLLALEGERLTAGLFDRYAEENFAVQRQQNALVDRLGLASPTMALAGLSMAAAGTDLAGHIRFLEQAEAYRYALVQGLNELQAGAVDYADDTAVDADADRRKRIASSHWRTLPAFEFEPQEDGSLARAALPGLGVILGWLIAGLLALGLATRRIGVA